MTATDAPRRRLLWRLVFGLSLALNVLVVSAGAGLMLSKRGGNEEAPPMRAGFVGPMLGVLPPEDRRAVLSQMHRFGKSIGVTRGGQEEVRAEIVALLEAEPFDAAALRQVLEQSNTRFSAFTEAAQAAICDRLETMPPAMRAEYVDRLKRFGTYRGDWKAGHKSDRDRDRDRDGGERDRERD
ncbi:periplasmic heavy metal sensor [Mangrovicoccus algicola]|uniref:Periplasmic heavy metal sensor n=1 Tax=Mangrovicoccus algicola TaxID=2771008 RepID=A0A8J7CJV9_9RHOB|nr:periplasmic heavy metal sensor [Mangrovicoccus algicola]MBE3637936.1 periplasmic heavy metal sensor [Mangrovicoccus algicola]